MKSREGLNVRGEKWWKSSDHGKVAKFPSLGGRLSDRGSQVRAGVPTTSTQLQGSCHFHHSRAPMWKLRVLLYIVVTIMRLDLILRAATYKGFW